MMYSIGSAPDYIACNLFTLLQHLYYTIYYYLLYDSFIVKQCILKLNNIINFNKSENKNKENEANKEINSILIENENENLIRIYGYSCRSLFYTFMRNESTKNTEIKILVTPLFHTSFRDIIEKFIRPQNIYIMEMNSKYTEIKKFDQNVKYDLIIINHMFGLDVNMNALKSYVENAKHNCLVVEDRVLGGTLNKNFSSPLIDMSFYSMGMDKLPNALGGGYININLKSSSSLLLKEISNDISKNINNYVCETNLERFIKIIKIIPTYIIYNCKYCNLILGNIVCFLSLFNHKINTENLTKIYREKNPGFTHFDYLKKPSQSLIMSMKKNISKYEYYEKKYTNQYLKYFNYFNTFEINKYYPWILDLNIKQKKLRIPYNNISLIYLSRSEKENFIKKIKYNLSYLKNPTYKVFNKNYEHKIADEEFNNNIIYIPSIITLNNKDMKKLHKIITK